MRVLLDDQNCFIDVNTIGEAVAAAADAAEQAGRLVVEVRVDGDSLSDEELQEPGRLEATAEEVQLLTTTMNILLRETFLHAAQALLEADAVQRNAAELMQGGQAAEGMQSLLGALETWSGIRDAVVKGLGLADVNPEEIVVNDVRLPDAIGGLQIRLGALKAAMVAEDVAATCDCLLYDLPESTRDWHIILGGLAERFSDPA